MTRKKERLNSSFNIKEQTNELCKQVLDNTIINIKFIDYEQKVFYYFDNGPVADGSVV